MLTNAQAALIAAASQTSVGTDRSGYLAVNPVTLKIALDFKKWLEEQDEKDARSKAPLTRTHNQYTPDNDFAPFPPGGFLPTPPDINTTIIGKDCCGPNSKLNLNLCTYGCGRSAGPSGYCGKSGCYDVPG